MRQGDFFVDDADALVSPANSFGIMDGGLEVLPTGHSRWPFLIVAPCSGKCGADLNAYLAFRAALVAVPSTTEALQAAHHSLVVPGFGTGVGAMDARRRSTV